MSATTAGRTPMKNLSTQGLSLNVWKNMAISRITKILEPETGWTRHTVITLLKRMEEKGTVIIDETGPVKLYSPKVTKEEATTDQTKKLLSHVFKGKASLLINNLVESGEISVDEMEEILNSIRRTK